MALQEDWLCRELALQGNVVQARAGQGFQVQARTYISCSLQSEILKFRVVLALSKMSIYIPTELCVCVCVCVMAPEECVMHNSLKIC